MVAIRISHDEARRIQGVTIARFVDHDGRVSVANGTYYAIVASSPAIGVAYSNEPHPGFERADANYRIGFANGIDGTIVCFGDSSVF